MRWLERMAQGKSTLIKIITGAVTTRHAEGSNLTGRPVTNNSPRFSKSLGIAAIYQQPALFPELTVAENVALGLEGATPGNESIGANDAGALPLCCKRPVSELMLMRMRAT